MNKELRDFNEIIFNETYNESQRKIIHKLEEGMLETAMIAGIVVDQDDIRLFSMLALNAVSEMYNRGLDDQEIV